MMDLIARFELLDENPDAETIQTEVYAAGKNMNLNHCETGLKLFMKYYLAIHRGQDLVLLWHFMAYRKLLFL